MAETSKNVHDTGPVGPRVAFVMAELGSGGIGRITVLLTRELVSRGFRVDLVLGCVAGPFVEQLDPRVRVVSIKTTHSLGSIIPLALYVRRARPAGHESRPPAPRTAPAGRQRRGGGRQVGGCGHGAGGVAFRF